MNAGVQVLADPNARRQHESAATLAGIDQEIEFVEFATNGVRLHAAVAGPESGPLVLLLHGFPEFWYGWRYQILPLARAGYRVVAPDQRGYNLSSKPRAVDAYRRAELARDILGILDLLGRDRAHVVGHDWGGGVAWWLGERHAGRLESLTVLNCPHHAVFARALKGDLRQMPRSWYILLFQVPHLAEWIARRGDYALGTRALAMSRREGAFSDEDVALYRRAWSQPGALRGMINWYRAAARDGFEKQEHRPISVRTLLLWGEADTALHESLAPPSIERARDGRLVMIPGASHWVMHDAPDIVTSELLAFLQA